MSRKSDGKHVVTKEIPIDDLPKVERQSALNEVRKEVVFASVFIIVNFIYFTVYSGESVKFISLNMTTMSTM